MKKQPSSAPNGLTPKNSSDIVVTNAAIILLSTHLPPDKTLEELDQW
jgi:hypothetical protein